MIKPITTLAILAVAFSAFAQSQTVKIKSKGDDVRTVIDSIFQQTGKQYVLETNLRQDVYMNLDGVSLDKAIEILSNLTDLTFEEKQGIYYIHKKMITAAQPFAAPAPTPTTVTNKTPAKPNPKTTKPVPTTTKKPNAPAKAPVTKKPVTKTTAIKPTPAKTTQTTEATAGQAFASTGTSIDPKTGLIDLNGRLTVQLKKMDIREVFAELGRQTKVEIEIDETVPNYKLDASFYNTTLKFALDKVCKVAGLKFTITPSNTVRISKA